MAMNVQVWKFAAAASLGALLLAGCSGGSKTGYGQGAGPTPPGVVSAAPSGGASDAAAAAALATAGSPLGTIVVNGQGMSAYVFDHDTAGSGTSACTGPCLSLWPAITAATGTPAVSGVTGKIATNALPDGKFQLTLNGLPLYTYTPDTKPGDTTGEGFGGIWWVVGADGHKITSAPSPAPSSSGYSGSGY